MWFELGILTAVLAVVLHLLALKRHKYWAEKGIPYVKPYPLVGNFGGNLTGKSSFPYILQDLYSTYPEKRYVGIYQFLSPTLLIRDLELIKKIIVKEFDTFPQHRPFVDPAIDPLWGNSLLAMKGGEKWRDMRSTLSPSFTSSKMKIMFELMKKCAQQFTQHFLKKGGTITVEMKDAFTRYTNDVIATTAFGITCNSLENPNNEFYLIGKETTNLGGIRGLKFFLGLISSHLAKVGIFTPKVAEFIRSLIKETIRVREEKGIFRPDMIHLLMEAKKGNLKNEDHGVAESEFAVVQESDMISPQKRQKVQITDDDIISQAAIFFVAGFDTASSLMCFTCHELALNHDIQDKLFQEISKALEDNKGDLTYELLQSMKYLDMVVTESLRKWPPTMATDRQSTRKFIIEPELPGEQRVELDVGTSCWVPIYALHRDPKYFPNPEKFDPERFSEESKHNIKPFSFFPFGAGPRNCIGSRFALLESKLVVVEVLRKFEITTVPKTQIAIKLTSKSVLAASDDGFWLGLKPRT